MAQPQLQSRKEVLYSKKASPKNSESPSLLQAEAIDLILERHIENIKYSYQISDRILKFLDGFQNELVNDVLLDSHENRFETDINRIDIFIERTHVKLHQLRSRMEASFEEEISMNERKEVDFLRNSFSYLGLLHSLPEPTALGVPYKEVLYTNLQQMRSEIVSNYKTSLVYNHGDSYLLEKFRGTKSLNYKDSIFGIFQNRFSVLFRTVFLEHLSKIRLSCYALLPQGFESFSMASPFPSDKKVSLYSLKDYSLISGSDKFEGPMENYNSTRTPVPILNEKSFNVTGLRSWFAQKGDSYQQKVLGKKRFLLWKKGGFSRAQIFNFKNVL